MSGAPPVGGTPGVTALHHVAVAARDADATADWYARHLGLHRHHDEEVPEAGVRLVWLHPTGTTTGTPLQIVQPLRPGPVATHLETAGEGLHHVCFAVDDLTSFLAVRPEQAGTRPFTGGYGLPCVFLADSPPGITIELVEQPAGRMLG